MGFGLIAAAVGATGALGALGSKSAGDAQADAAEKAAQAQVEATQLEIDYAQGIYDDTIARFDPFYNSGLDAQSAYMYELMGGPVPTIGQTYTAPQIETIESTKSVPAKRIPSSVFDELNGYFEPRYTKPTTETFTEYRVGENVFDSMDEAEAYANANKLASGGYEYQGFQATPGYEFRLNEGLGAVESSTAASQGLNSGATMKALQRYGQDYATSEYNNYLNRLAGAASQGQAAAGSQAGAGQFASQQIGNAYSQQGNALAQGYLTAGNAQAAGTMGAVNAINGGITNGLGAWQFNQLFG